MERNGETISFVLQKLTEIKISFCPNTSRTGKSFSSVILISNQCF